MHINYLLRYKIQFIFTGEKRSQTLVYSMITECYISSSISSNETNNHQVPPAMIHGEEHSITSVAFLPKSE